MMKFIFCVFNFIIISICLTGTMSFMMNPLNPPIVCADGMVQQITPNNARVLRNCFSGPTHLYCVDRDTQQVIDWDMLTGETTKIDLSSKIPNEDLAFYFTGEQPTEIVVGSKRNVRFGTNKNGKINLEEPIPVTTQKGYWIEDAHADEKGALVLTTKHEFPQRYGSQLFVLKDKKVKLLKQFDYNIGDFAFNKDNTKLLLITHDCTCVSQYDYDLDQNTLTNEELVHNFTEELSGTKLTGIEVDLNGNLWLIFANSDCNNLHQWDMEKKNFTAGIKIPTTDLTSMTWGGGPLNNGLMVASSKQCLPYEPDQGTVYYVSGIFGGGIKDNDVVTM